MMRTLRKHRCGGTLHPRELEIRSEEGGLTFQYPHPVPGFVCDRCGAEVVDRDVAGDIEKNMTPTIWFTPDSGTYRTEAVRLRGVISSTPGVAA